MQKKRATSGYTESEIRRQLREKLRSSHPERLQAFRQTGRAVALVRDAESGEMSPFFHEIEISPIKPETADHSRPHPGVRIANHFLGFLETGAVVGIAILLLLILSGLSTLNRRAAAAWVFPTFTPTPLIRAVVLPDGHTPPNSPGGSRPNVEEVPSHLRPIVLALANLPTPTPAPQQAIRIQIPALNIDSPVVQGDGWEQLMKGVAQHLGTANPGEKGNMVLSGHNDVYGEVFRYLDRLKPGDQVTLFTSTRTFTYVVEGWKLVAPDQVEVMDQTPDETLTLISCYPYLVDTQRIVVKARLMNG